MMDFFDKKRCDRCNGGLEGGRIQSMFNEDCLCMPCKAKEEQHPKYDEARRAEYDAILRQDNNFTGVGKPPDL